MESVNSAVRTDCLYKADNLSSLKCSQISPIASLVIAFRGGIKYSVHSQAITTWKSQTIRENTKKLLVMQEQQTVTFNAFNNEGVVESCYLFRQQENISFTCTMIRCGGMQIFCTVWGKAPFFQRVRMSGVARQPQVSLTISNVVCSIYKYYQFQKH
jgi:hypothetical protein